MNAVLHLDIETLPLSFVAKMPMPDDAFEALCIANDTMRLERTREGGVVVHAPAGGFTSSGNVEILRQLSNWWIGHRRGRVFDSNCGFFLADGSMLGPDAAYVVPEKMQGLDKRDLTRLPHFCPDFVIELLSSSDRPVPAKAKMDSWIANGVQLGWLIDPYQRQVLVYQPGSAPSAISADSIEGSGPIAGFTLDVSEVWRCYEL